MKLVISRKTDFLFAGLNLNIIIQKKKCQKKAHFVDDILKTRGIVYLNVETWLLFAPPSKFLATRLVMTQRICTFPGLDQFRKQRPILQ